MAEAGPRLSPHGLPDVQEALPGLLGYFHAPLSLTSSHGEEGDQLTDSGVRDQGKNPSLATELF